LFLKKEKKETPTLERAGEKQGKVERGQGWVFLILSLLFLFFWLIKEAPHFGSTINDVT